MEPSRLWQPVRTVIQLLSEQKRCRQQSPFHEHVLLLSWSYFRVRIYSGRRCTDGGIPDRQPNPSFPKRSKAPPPGKALRPLFKRDVQLHTSGSGLPVIFAYAPENMEEALESFAAFFREGSFFFLSRDSFRQLSDVSSLSAEKLLSGEKEQRFLLHHLKAMGLPASKEALLTAPLSDGQQKTLLFLHTLFSLSRTGGVVIADDLTVFLHPNVSRYLVQLIQSPRNSNIQLLFTTHDTALLDHDLFRRDEAAIINLDAEGRSRIHTLADIRIRFDANFAREYLSGKYGLLPVWDQEE